MTNKHKHAEDVLWDDFIVPNSLTVKKLSEEAGIQKTVLYGIISGDLQIDDATAKKLAEYFNNTVLFWLLLNRACDKA